MCTASRSQSVEPKTRIERFKGLMNYTDAFSFASEFYTDKSKHGAASESFKSGGERL
jgi:hypothetical protein